MSLLAIAFRFEDANPGTLIRGMPVYDNEGKRVGQLVAIHADQCTTYGAPVLMAVEDVRTPKS